MGLFKKKDGSKTLFGKITSSVAKVYSTVGGAVANVVVPGSGAIVSGLWDKVDETISGKKEPSLQTQVMEKTGGVVDLSDYLPQTGETIPGYTDRLKSAAGAAVAAADSAMKSTPKNPLGLGAFEWGFIKAKLPKYLLIAGGVILTIFGLVKIIKRK